VGRKMRWLIERFYCHGGAVCGRLGKFEGENNQFEEFL